MTGQDVPNVLDGKRAVVTGAGRGVGRAVAEQLAGAGVRVLLVARTAVQLDDVAESIRQAGGVAETLSADVARPDTPSEVAHLAVDRLGGVDILINNAAVVAPLAADSTTVDRAVWARALAVNVTAPIMLDLALSPAMVQAGWGRIVNVSSGVVARPESMVGGNAYVTTKAALEAHTVNLAAEIAESGVTVNVYRPGTVDTAMQAWIREQPRERVGADLHSRFADFHASGRLIPAEESARALLRRLSGPENGQVWSVDDAGPPVLS